MTAPDARDDPNTRRLAWFTDDELRAELDRRFHNQLRELLLHVVLHNEDGDLVLDGVLPAREIARRLDEDAVPVITAWAQRRVL